MTPEEAREAMVRSILNKPSILDDLLKSLQEEAVDWDGEKDSEENDSPQVG